MGKLACEDGLMGKLACEDGLMGKLACEDGLVGKRVYVDQEEEVYYDIARVSVVRINY